MTNANRHEYQPLPDRHIRVLTLDTLAPGISTPSGQLGTVSLGPDHDSRASVEFHALSYAWGEQTETFPFLIDGHELSIHRNLRDAILRLPVFLTGMPIWIDAICIDQANAVEKLGQIRLMAEIYTKALNVWAWLGEEEEGTADAVQLLPQLANVAPTIIEALHFGHPIDPDSFQIPSASSTVWPALLSLAMRSWFRRLWAVQEYSLATKSSSFVAPIVFQWIIL